MIDTKNITNLRMQRQFLHEKANLTEYKPLYRDTQPGQNEYWHGFGQPPILTFRANFDDIEYNRERQKNRILIKGRFQGGNLGWIERDDLELFAGLCMKKLDKPTERQLSLLKLIKHEGPMNIQYMKEATGMLVKEITPILHRLQEAFLIYEDQYDGEWDRGWYLFFEMFPDVNLDKYTRHEALKIILQKFAYRHVHFDIDMAKSFYKLPIKDIKSAADELVTDGIFLKHENGYMLQSDFETLKKENYDTVKSVFVMHRNDFLIKSNYHILKEKFNQSEHETLQYVLIDGTFSGAVIGKFKYGPYIIEDVVVDIPNAESKSRKSEIIEAVCAVNNHDYSQIKRYNGEEL